MIDYRIFNKSKKKKIILIHGLFANSGFWLSYLKYFKNHKLIICDLNYSDLFKMNLNQLKLFLNHFIKKLNINFSNDIIISHSMGTVIGKIISSKYDILSFEICPTYLGSRKLKANFLLDIEHINNISFDQANITYNNVKSFMKLNSDSLQKLNSSSFLFVTNEDQYYTYELKNNRTILFSGDHFNIFQALNKISTMI